MRKLHFISILVAASVAPLLHAQELIYFGKVMMADGSPPPKPALVERYCGVGRVSVVTKTGKDGKFTARLNDFDPHQSATQSLKTGYAMISCVLRAELSGYRSSVIPLDSVRPLGDPNLPPLVLLRAGTERDTASLPTLVPSKIQKSWQRVALDVKEDRWQQAETHLREVTATAPDFAAAWTMLGVVANKLDRPDEARSHLRRAIQLDPKSAEARHLLTQLEINAGQWEAARDAAAELNRVDKDRRYPQAHLYDAIARFNLGDLDGARSSAAEALKIDADHRLTRAEYILGRVDESKHDYQNAVAHYRRYLESTPGAPEAASLRDRINRIESGQAVDEPTDLPAVRLEFSVAGEVWIPGGVRALANISHATTQFSPQTFFADYCRALVLYNTPGRSDGISGYMASLRSYFAAVAELSQMGVREGARTRLTLSLAPESRKATSRILALFGWQVVEGAGGPSVELGDNPAGVARQSIPAALGIDAVQMQDELNAGRPFEFELLSERVPLFGGDSWLAMVNSARPLSGGLAEAFADTPRLAMAYAGLSTLPNAAVDLLINALGPRNIAARYAGLLLNYGSAFDLANGAMNVPGASPDAAAAWEQFAGVTPRNAGGFARALLDRDRGNGAAFYAAVKAATPDRQTYLIAGPTLARAYSWFAEIGPERASAVVKELPVEPAGVLRIPGGAAAWPGTPLASHELPDGATAERLVAIAELEIARRAPFDAGIVTLLVRRYDEWRSVFPYFEKISSLTRADFEALDAFTNAVRRLPPDRQNIALGAWHSIVELIAMRTASHSDIADAFRQACNASPTSASIAAALGALLGKTRPVNEAAIANLLGLNPAREREFHQILAFQRVPRLDASLRSSDVARVVQSLTGIVYAASFPSSGLLISEDEELVRKHEFVESGGPLFAPAKLVSDPNGSRISGGFLNLRAIAERLAVGGESETGAARNAEATPQTGAPILSAKPDNAGAIFRTDARLVMVSATVTDARDRYVDDLEATDFQIIEDGRARPAAGFESLSSGVSCALLLDTTGSMYAALPALKSAAMRFIRDLRPVDSVAVYSFSDSVSLLQPFTSDKGAAKRAVMGTRAAGQTALYDALTRVSRDLASRPGKKVIVVFTDGEDNLSRLASGLAVRRIKAIGTPVYTIAQGQALLSHPLLKHLAELSVVTGGLPFRVERTADIGAVFERISSDLAHGYLLSFQPSAAGGSRDWHRIEVVARRDKRYKVRAREGYFNE